MNVLAETVWHISRGAGHLIELTFMSNGCFKYTNIKTKSGSGQGSSYGDSDERWTLTDNKIRISFNNDYMVKVGEVYEDGTKMSGTYSNIKGLKGSWNGSLLRHNASDKAPEEESSSFPGFLSE